nr:hypothetical protein GW17_00017144 [Ipomoea batatas]
MSQSRDNVDCEANEKRSDGGIDRAKEWKDDGQKPYGMRMTAMSRKGVLGRREKALEWSRSKSPNAQYTAAAEGNVSVNTYIVANSLQLQDIIYEEAKDILSYEAPSSSAKHTHL